MSPPEEVVDEAVRLSRLARRAVDDQEAEAYRTRRDRLLERHGYRARIRVEGGALGGADPDDHRGGAGTSADRGDPPRGQRAVLVCYPAEWVVDGAVDPTRIEDTARAIERPLSGPDGDAEWAEVEAHNRAVAERIASDHGPAHGENAHAFADFMSNHYARRVETATDAEVAEFLEEYFPRNAWPTDAQREVVSRTVALIRDP